MPLPVTWFGTVLGDVVAGNLNLVTEPLTVSLHGVLFNPVGSMTTTGDLSDEVVGSGYTPLTLTGKAVSVTRTGDTNVVRFTANDAVWAALSPSARYAVVSAGTRLVFCIDGGLSAAGGGEGRIDFTIEVAAGTADPNSNARTRRTLDFLRGRAGAGSVDRFVLGQHLGQSTTSSTSGGQADWDAIAAIAGQRPQMMGGDYDGGSQNYANLNPLLEAHQASGGIVAISIHARIPAIGVDHEQYRQSTVKLDMDDMVTVGHPTYEAWHDRIDTYMAGLLDLQARDVSPILGPLHECTAGGDSFNWCVANPSQTTANYIAAYRQLMSHLWDGGCHNILSLWHPHDANTSGNPLGLSRTRFYPGDAYVDLVGPSVYDPDPANDGKTSVLNDLRINVPGKVHGLAEFGWKAVNGSPPASAYPIDYRKWVEFIKSQPHLAFGKNWSGSWSMHRHLSLNDAVNDPWLIKLGGTHP